MLRAFFVLVSLLSTGIAHAQTTELVIYAYDSLVAKGGLGSAIFPLFEKKCGCRIKALPSGDGGQLLSRLQLDQRRGSPTAHIALGLDQQTWERARALSEDWGKWRPKGYAKLPKEFQIDSGFVPFDYGVFAWMADLKLLAELKLKAPTTLADLLKPEYAKKLILEDPRTSTPGLAFLLYTQDIFGKGTREYWEKFRHQWLTLSSGWDEAYGLFLKGEAPLVWSYTTSQAYHREHGDSGKRYQAVIFQEGQPVQIEGAMLVKGGSKSERERTLSREFMDFLLSKEVQELLPTKNWMLPVVKDVALPKSFEELPQAKRLLGLRRSAQDSRAALALWDQAVHTGRW